MKRIIISSALLRFGLALLALGWGTAVARADLKTDGVSSTVYFTNGTSMRVEKTVINGAEYKKLQTGMIFPLSGGCFLQVATDNGGVTKPIAEVEKIALTYTRRIGVCDTPVYEVKVFLSGNRSFTGWMVIGNITPWDSAKRSSPVLKTIVFRVPGKEKAAEKPKNAAVNILRRD